MRTRKILALVLAALTILLAVPPIPAGATYSGGASLVYSTGTTNKVVADKYGNVYLLKTDGLVKWDGQSFTQISTMVFDELAVDGNGVIYGLATADKKVYKASPPTYTFQALAVQPWSYYNQYYYSMLHFYTDSKNRLWILRAYIGKNSYVEVNRYDGTWTQKTYRYSYKSSEAPDHVCYVDRQYNIWITPHGPDYDGGGYNSAPLMRITPELVETTWSLTTINITYPNLDLVLDPTNNGAILVWPPSDLPLWYDSRLLPMKKITEDGQLLDISMKAAGSGRNAIVSTNEGWMGLVVNTDPTGYYYWTGSGWSNNNSIPWTCPPTNANHWFKDAEGNIWFYYYSGLLYKATHSTPAIQLVDSAVKSFPALDSSGNIWYVRNDGKVYRINNTVSGNVTKTNVTQTSIALSWSFIGAIFDRYELYDGATLIYSGSATTFNHTSLVPGEYHTYKVRAHMKYPDGWTDFQTITVRTIPPTPPVPSGTVTPLSWSNVTGRARIVLNWPSQQGATGYKVWVFDGNTYRAFDVGNVTTWDSSVARIYPPESQLDGYGDNTQSKDLFYHNQGGLDLRDDPNKLYRKMVGSTYDSAHNYWFCVSAYNESGESPRGNAYMPTCPNRTDTQAPQVVSVVINDGDAKTGLASVKVTVTAKDPAVANHTSDTSDDASGVKQIRFSNDNTVWSAWQAFDSTATAPNESRTRNFTWNLSAGGGTKTVYVQVMDQAGNVSATMADTILFVDDVTAPSASFMINGGDASTASRYVSLAITATDDLTPMSNLQMRFSNDGLNFSPWEPFAPTKNWDLAWPGTSASDGQKTVYMQVKDAQGNTTTVASKIGLNQSTPTGSLSPASGISGTVTIGGSSVSTRFVNNTRVVLNLQPTSADRVQYSLDGITWSPWERVTGTVSKQLTVPPGDGQKTIYIKWGNSYGGESPVQSVEFTLDMTPPRLDASWLGGATVTKNGQATLVLDAVDNISGRTGLTAKIVVGTTSPVTYNYSSVPRTVTLSFSGSGAQVVTVYVYDQAGNEASKTLTIFN